MSESVTRSPIELLWTAKEGMFLFARTGSERFINIGDTQGA